LRRKTGIFPYFWVVEWVVSEGQPENNPVRVDVVFCEAGSGERDFSTKKYEGKRIRDL